MFPAWAYYQERDRANKAEAERDEAQKALAEVGDRAVALTRALEKIEHQLTHQEIDELIPPEDILACDHAEEVIHLIGSVAREARLRGLGYSDERPDGGCADALGLERSGNKPNGAHR